MAVIENTYFQFNNDPQTGSFNIFSQEECFPDLINNTMGITGQLQSGKRFIVDCQLHRPLIPDSHFVKESKVLQFSGEDVDLNIAWKVIFKLSPDGKLFMWQMTVTNNSKAPVFVERINLLKPVKVNFPNFRIENGKGAQALRFFSNGWQSWSYTGAYNANDRMRRSKLGILQEPMVLNPGTPSFRRADKFSSDLFAVLADRSINAGMVLGFLSQKQHFGTITADLQEPVQVEVWANGDQTRLQPMSSISTDWMVCGLCKPDDPESLATYFDVVARENGINQLRPPPTGWCSWYYFYQDISDEAIEENLNMICEIKESTPLELIQIDDGYQQEVGDWFSFDTKFPHGLKNIAKKIKENRFIPGLWLAPFIVHPRSQLAKDHPDWLLRRENNKWSRAGFVWNSLPFALDLTVPGVMDYVCQVIDAAVHQWGFSYLKLDFLYAAALEGRYYDDSKTRAQVLWKAMKRIREAAGDKVFLLGCGAPLGSMLGIVDGMRIGADVSETWKPIYFNISFPFKNEPYMPSAENSIHNTITRAFLHNRWWINDPDCLLVRDDSDLSEDEVRTLATMISLTGGSVVLSDNMEKVSEERLKIIRALIPPINQRAKVLDWMETGTPSRLRLDLQGAAGGWHLISYSNWDDQPKEIHLTREMYGLDEDVFFISSFWDKRSWKVKPGEFLFTGMIHPHATILLAVRRVNRDVTYIGSSLHISQGLEVSSFYSGRNKCEIKFTGKKRISGFVELALSRKPESILYEGKEIQWRKMKIGSYRLSIENKRTGTLALTY